MQVEAKYITSRDEWLRWRLHDVTGTDIGALAGVDKHRSPRCVYEEKTKHWVDDADNDVLRRGRWMEAAVIEAVQEKHPDWRVLRNKHYFRAPEHHLGATPDAEGDDEGNSFAIECKSVLRDVFETDWNGKPPLKTELQTLSNMMLLRYQRALVAVLVMDYAGIEYREFWIERHAQAEDRILNLAAEFWRRVENNDPPDFDFSQDAGLIRQIYARPEVESVDLSQHTRIGALCEQKLQWLRRKSNAEGALETLDAEICEALGDAEVGEHPDFKITWKLQKKKEHTVPAKEFRTLRVTRKRKQQEAA